MSFEKWQDDAATGDAPAPAAPELPDDLAAPTAQDSHVAIARDARAQEQALHEILNRSNEISRATIVSAGGA